MDSLYEYMQIPKSCKVGNTIFKKLFYDYAELSKVDRDLITNQVDKIVWSYCIKPDTIHIKSYKDEIREYSEIEIIEVFINTSDKTTKRIAEIIMRTIPYPMVLVFLYKTEIQLFVAHQRSNLTDKSKNTIEELICTDWIDTKNLSCFDDTLLKNLEFNSLSSLHLYSLYSDLVNIIITYNASKLVDTQIQQKADGDIKRSYEQLLQVDKEIEKLRISIKKETSINRRVELNIALVKLKERRNILLEGLVKNE